MKKKDSITAGNHDSLSLMTAAMVAGKAKNLYLKFHTRNRVNLETSKPAPCPAITYFF